MSEGSVKDGKIREAIVDGIFYPSEKAELRAEVDRLLTESKTKASDAFGIITPHAGFSYAGQYMASAFKAVERRKIKNVVILGPAHNPQVDQVVLPESKHFLTPIGSMKVNMDLVDEFLSCSNGIVLNDIPHLEEHCIEVQLPFIRYMFPEAGIVPILLGTPSEKNIKLLTNALFLTFRPLMKETLLVVTANMNAYDSGKGARQEAERLISLIEAHDGVGIKEGLLNKRINSCGAGCLAATLSFLPEGYEVKVLNRGSSADVGKEDETRVVHYAAISLSVD